MVGIAGLRNVLVHEYTSVDARIVVRILREHLEDLEQFGAAARRWI